MGPQAQKNENFSSKEYHGKITYINEVNGDPYWIRTSDLLLRRQLLYPAELRNHDAVL